MDFDRIDIATQFLSEEQERMDRISNHVSSSVQNKSNLFRYDWC